MTALDPLVVDALGEVILPPAIANDAHIRQPALSQEGLEPADDADVLQTEGAEDFRTQDDIIASLDGSRRGRGKFLTSTRE